MLTSQVFKSRLGQHYTLRLANQGISSLPNGIKSKRFTDKNTAWQFVSNLQVSLFFWEKLAYANSFFNYANWKKSKPGTGIEHYIAQALIQGSVRVYETVSLRDLNESRQQRRFKDPQGKQFELQHTASLLVNAVAEVQPVLDTRSAEKIIQDLSITAESAEVLNKSLNVTTGSGDGSSATGNSIETLKAAMVRGDVVLTQVPEPLKPSTTDVFVEAVSTANESLGPAAPAPAPAPAPVESAPVETSPTRAENATAEGLTKAAEEGTPFCEECEKANAA